jgi:sulfatase-modifying factor enzyme 1
VPLNDTSALAQALADAQQRSLQLFTRLDAALAPSGQPRYLPELSPPRWDLGHLAWLEAWQVARNPMRHAGLAASGNAPRGAALLPQLDHWFDNRRVTHPERWHQPVPAAPLLLDLVRRSREQTLALLAQRPRGEQALEVYQHVLRSEWRLHEDWIGIAQTLGADPGETQLDPAPLTGDAITAQPADTIDPAPVSWSRYLPFIEAGGYEDKRWWSAEGWIWRQRTGLKRPRHLSHDEGQAWRRARFERWVPLDPAEPAVHLSLHEAEAWCRWAGRRLPTRAEWSAWAASDAGAAHWGQVWEWVSDGAAGAGLIGASFATPPGLRQQPLERGLEADRNDGFSGFRSAPPGAA